MKWNSCHQPAVTRGDFFLARCKINTLFSHYWKFKSINSISINLNNLTLQWHSVPPFIWPARSTPTVSPDSEQNFFCKCFGRETDRSLKRGRSFNSKYYDIYFMDLSSGDVLDNLMFLSRNNKAKTSIISVHPLWLFVLTWIYYFNF